MLGQSDDPVFGFIWSTQVVVDKEEQRLHVWGH